MADDPESLWRPSANLENLRLRSRIIAEIRNFFAQRGVLEVETPLLCKTTTTDPHVASFKFEQPNNTALQSSDLNSNRIHFSKKTHPSNVYLQTSPEFAMKRLLASGSGCIYQICKAFRLEESGRYHHPEFSMLEWYRVGFDHHQLMDEIDAMMQTVANTEVAERISYREIFQNFLDINPHTSDAVELEDCARLNGIKGLENPNPNDTDFWLHLLLSHCIEPHLGRQRPVFIFDFPASQAALARICSANSPIAERFELYWNGIELANGYHELTDVTEQQRRCYADNDKRHQLNLPKIPIDEQLMAALANGMPDCAGVALGLDRLVMLIAKERAIKEVISFVD